MKSRFQHPYQRALVTITGLVGFALLTVLVTWGLSLIGAGGLALAYLGLVFTVFFALLFLIILLLGWYQMQCTREFLESDRVLMRWTYSETEWQQMKSLIWQDEKEDWKIQWGCLTLLFILPGLLTGILIGLEGGFIDVIINGVIGLFLGGLAGGAIGALVAGGNYWGARQAYKRFVRGQVALGVNEIYANDTYFRGNETSNKILDAEMLPGNPATLKLRLLFPFRLRMPREEEWLVRVPPQRVEQVAEILPVLIQEEKTCEG